MNPPDIGIKPGPDDVPEQIDGDEEPNEKRENSSGHRCAIKRLRFDLRKGKGRDVAPARSPPA